MSDGDSVVRRLRERKIVQWALAYLAAAFVVFQSIEVAADPWGITPGLQRLIHVLLLFGLFVVLILAWYHGEQGRQRVSGPELALITLLLLIAAAILAIFRPGTEAADGSLARAAWDPERDRPAIAVLPFENISPDPDDAYFADGMHEEIITRLSQVSAITVISRTSTLQYRESPKSIRNIADELRVDYILEGSARMAGEKVRLTVQLIDARTDEHIWSEMYDRDITAEQLFAMQGDVAQNISQTLQARLTPGERERLRGQPTLNLEAYQHYLRGRYYTEVYTPESWQTAIDYFDQAIELDPDFARAYAGLALAYTVVGDTTQARNAAQEAYEKAIELDDGIGEAYTALAIVKASQWDWDGAARDYERALELTPNDANLMHYYGHYLMTTGRPEEAVAAARRGVQIDPFSPPTHIHLGWELFYAGHYEEAIQQLEQARGLDPDFWALDALIGYAHLQRGWPEQAIAHLEGNDDEFHRAVLACAYVATGRESEARRILAELQGGTSAGDHSQGEDLSHVRIAQVHACLGEHERAIARLDAAVDAREGGLMDLTADPILGVLHPEAGFQRTLRRMGLAESG